MEYEIFFKNNYNTFINLLLIQNNIRNGYLTSKNKENLILQYFPNLNINYINNSILITKKNYSEKYFNNIFNLGKILGYSCPLSENDLKKDVNSYSFSIELTYCYLNNDYKYKTILFGFKCLNLKYKKKSILLLKKIKNYLLSIKFKYIKIIDFELIIEKIYSCTNLINKLKNKNYILNLNEINQIKLKLNSYNDNLNLNKYNLDKLNLDKLNLNKFNNIYNRSLIINILKIVKFNI